MEDLKSQLADLNKQQVIFYEVKVPLIQKYILHYIQLIRSVNSFDLSKKYFEILEELSGTAALLICQYKVNLPDIIWTFFKDFDRVGEDEEKSRLYKKIKNDEFYFKSDFSLNHETYNNIMINEFLKNIEQEQEDFYFRKLPYLQQEVLYYMNRIKDCNTVDEAKEFLDHLQEIQETLEGLINKYEITLPYKLSRFVHECYRLDDQGPRNYLFDAIKYKNYSLEKS